jgi:DNA-binding Lrp family transcriptional regulator
MRRLYQGLGLGITLDELDKKIISNVCGGIYSYNDLAKRCGVGRSTIYRRLERLEESGVITKMVMAIPDFTELGLSAISIVMDVNHKDKDRVIEFLKHSPKVKFLWRSYGSFNVTVVIICDKGEEGGCISNLRHHLEEMDVDIKRFESAVSFVWEKVDLSPY